VAVAALVARIEADRGLLVEMTGRPVTALGVTPGTSSGSADGG
jgi:hypothetical protein